MYTVEHSNIVVLNVVSDRRIRPVTYTTAP